MMEDITVMDDKMQQIPMDSTTLGEIMIRGNSVMKGYYKNEEATKSAFEGGYFHSGDIAIQHPDSYIQIADRAKDIIISGGENISSVEIEGVLMAHESVSLCAVVAMPDEKWGEVPCAFVELLPNAVANADELIDFSRTKIAGFKFRNKALWIGDSNNPADTDTVFQLTTGGGNVEIDNDDDVTAILFAGHSSYTIDLVSPSSSAIPIGMGKLNDNSRSIFRAGTSTKYFYFDFNTSI
jgi:acyl-CoA synthetase (AMP-forming)/AMP-acid ligase II